MSRQRPEQSNITPVEAAHMFYTMTRGRDWPYERWHGPIFAGNNLVESEAGRGVCQAVREPVQRREYAIPEIGGRGVHIYGNYEYGPKAGDPNVVWTEDVPVAEIAGVYRSMGQLDAYLAERRPRAIPPALGDRVRTASGFGLVQSAET